jgi:uncharacterized protein (DUF58 family)
MFAFGGVSLFVILVLLLVAVIIGSVLYATAGTLWGRKMNPEQDKLSDPEQDQVSGSPEVPPRQPRVRSEDDARADRIFADDDPRRRSSL